MSYLAKLGSVYCFRRIVPDDLRLALGKRESMLSLRTKDREEAKRLIPVEIINPMPCLPLPTSSLSPLPSLSLSLGPGLIART
jgi:hypothetical protein